MQTTTSSSQSADERIAKAVRQYLESLERDHRVDRREFVAQHGDIAEELEGCLDTLELIEDYLPHFAHASADALEEEVVATDPHAERGHGLRLGDYEIVRRIGRGGMGVVYEARQISLHRPVALKILPLAALLDPRALKRFQTEAVAAASLDHPHIVGIYSVGCERGIHYYAMQYVPGQTLGEVIRDQRGSLVEAGLEPTRHGPGSRMATDDESDPGPALDTQPLAAMSTEGGGLRKVSFRAAATLGLQAAEALEFAHQMGIVHRDIKPSNLLVDEQGELWITDFGLAMTRGDTTVTITGDLVGTLRYMSPEQVGGQRRILDHRTDVYSLGITLYELLALQPAFTTDDRQVLMRQILENNPIALRKVRPGIPRDLETIVHKAIDKQPDRRYQSAQDMADDLRRFTECRPILARRAGWPRRCSRWIRRNRAVTALLMTAISLAVFLAVAGPLAARRETILRQETKRRNNVLAVHSAYEAFELGDLKRARALLAEVSRDRRFFAWHHLWSLLDFVDSTPTLHHGAPVTDVSLSPDERVLATAGEDGTVKLWELRPDQRRLVRVLNVDPNAVHCIAFFPDGQTLAAGGSASVTLWHIPDGTRKREFVTGHVVYDIAVSPNAACVAWSNWDDADQSTLSVWRVGSPDVFCRAVQAEEIRCVAFSPDSAWLASAGLDSKARLWSLRDTGTSVCLDEGSVFRHRNHLFAVAFSPDGNFLAAGGYHYETRVWDLKTGHLKISLRSQGHSVTSLAFADGRTLITGGWDNCASVWNLTTGERREVIRGHDSDVSSVALTHDGAMLVTGSRDGTAKLWSVPAAGDVAEPGNYRTSIAFIPGTRSLLFGNSLWGRVDTEHYPQGARVFDLMTGQAVPLVAPDEAVDAIAVAPKNNPLLPGGGLVATGSHRAGEQGEVRLWNSRTGQTLARIEMSAGSSTDGLAFSPDGKNLAIADSDGRLLVWDFVRGEVQWDRNVGSNIFSLAYTPEGQELWIGVGTVLIRGKQWRGGDIERRTAATGEPLPSLRGHGDIVMRVAFSPGGNSVATASLDKTVRIWDWERKTTRLILSGHSSWVFSVAFSPDGRTLASGSADGTVRLWDPESGDELAVLTCLRGVGSVAFSPDGKTLAAGHTDRSVSLWHADLERQSWPRSLH